ncbi:MAG: hypothetical protein DWQ05_06965 [Calditrichaeota bacterium]|nr:MAG: hypothetical protein DWQ05_06965 [Calditrichota bacterium]
MIGIIGIRSETKDTTEKRAALTPEHVQSLVKNDGIEVHVQPSAYRIFNQEAYIEAGARITEDLGNCNVIFGVKEVPIKDLYPGKPHVFFSHTIKGQDYNMPLLKEILRQKVTLIEYESIKDAMGRRLIFFGKFAGYAGMINSLWTFGQRMRAENIDSPFTRIKQANQYDSLIEAREAIIEVGRVLKSAELPENHPPVVIALLGEGNVTQGAVDIANLLPVQDFDPAELLEEKFTENISRNHVQKVVFNLKDWLEHNTAGTPFVEKDYFANPGNYHAIFENYVEHLTIIINGNFWAPGLPKILTKSFIKKLFSQPKKPLIRVVGDISCDIEGSVEFNLQATKSDNPVYVYLPEKNKIEFGVHGNGPIVLAVDKLPSEIPREAASEFGNALSPFVPDMANCNFEVTFENLNLPMPIKNAIITHRGELTPKYKYLQKFL